MDDIKIEKVFNYNIDNLLALATINGVKPENNYNGSWFLINKKTKKARAYSPMEDLDAFERATKNPISNKGGKINV